MKARTDWLYTLTECERDELVAATTGSAGIELHEMDRASFALPTFGPTLQAIVAQVLDGRGFALIRGLPVVGLPSETAARMYWGIGRWLGEAVSQNRQGHRLGHVCDVGARAAHHAQRGFQSSDPLPYHTDVSADIVSLLCLRCAVSGGESSIVSAGALYNEMLQKAPELLAELCQPLYWDRRGEHDSQMQPWYQMPVFTRYKDRLLTSYIRRFIDGAQRFQELPRLTHSQRAALDMLSKLAATKPFYMQMAFRPGDLQLLNNLAILHNRTAYRDHPDPARRRHLLRLWIASASAWPLPTVYHERFGVKTASGRPAGIMTGQTRLSIPIDPPSGIDRTVY